MRIEITGRRLTLTDPIRVYAHEKAEKLLKYYDGVQQIKVVLDQERHDHRDEFSAEVLVDLVKHDPLVARAEASDVYASVDMVIEKAGRQIKEFKAKLRDHH